MFCCYECFLMWWAQTCLSSKRLFLNDSRLTLRLSVLQINTDYRSEFARCLEPLLLLGQRCPPSISGSTSVAARWLTPQECSHQTPRADNLLSPWHHFFREIQKVWAENFTLVRDPNSKSPNGLQVQMAVSYDSSEAPCWVPLWQLFCLS